MTRKTLMLGGAALLLIVAVPAGPIAGGILIGPHAAAMVWLATLE
jgi:hypothetical protein